MCYIHRHTWIGLDVPKNEVTSSVGQWMQPEIIMLRESSQSHEKQMSCFSSFVNLRVQIHKIVPVQTA